MLSDRLQTEELPQINMTPMVDVVLCLLVFFMAATRLYDWDEEQFSVKVPEVSTAAPLTSAPQDMTLAVIAPGQVEIDGKVYNLPDLTTLLRAARVRYEDQGVLIRGQARLDYQAVADVLSACEDAGVKNVRLTVRPRDSQPDSQ